MGQFTRHVVRVLINRFPPLLGSVWFQVHQVLLLDSKPWPPQCPNSPAVVLWRSASPAWTGAPPDGEKERLRFWKRITKSIYVYGSTAAEQPKLSRYGFFLVYWLKSFDISVTFWFCFKLHQGFFWEPLCNERTMTSYPQNAWTTSQFWIINCIM